MPADDRAARGDGVTRLDHPAAEVAVEEIGAGRRRIVVRPLDGSMFVPIRECDTVYSLELIARVLEVKGPAYLCDEILRDESPGYVQKQFQHDVFSYLDQGSFAGRRLLDFGCGAGASTMILSRLFPDTAIVGIELEPSLLRLASARAEFYGCRNVVLHQSPAPDQLPDDLGRFDFVMMSAVYEHLLPDERAVLLRALWALLEPGGVLFLNQTPYRYFPVEFHSTSGLPFINYLPAFLAGPYARRFSIRKLQGQSWTELLRGGLRGGSVREIVALLGPGGKPVLLEPSRLGVEDRIDLWYAKVATTRYRGLKRVYRGCAKLFKRATGIVVLPVLSLAIRKG
jgi:2-polyprenyl-3-methyl-5-hydroxy-6-metoxy-1,4-benzoquinol methylase